MISKKDFTDYLNRTIQRSYEIFSEPIRREMEKIYNRENRIKKTNQFIILGYTISLLLGPPYAFYKEMSSNHSNIESVLRQIDLRLLDNSNKIERFKY